MTKVELEQALAIAKKKLADEEQAHLKTKAALALADKNAATVSAQYLTTRNVMKNMAAQATSTAYLNQALVDKL